MIERGRRCPVARIVMCMDGKRTRSVGYADTVKEALPLQMEVN